MEKLYGNKKKGGEKMNIKGSYENLKKAKTELEEMQGKYDVITNAKISNIASRIELTLIDLKLEIDEK